jgi:hypothetical protein
MRLPLVLAGVLLIATAACGERPIAVLPRGDMPLSTGGAPPADPAAALDAWTSFPVGRKPRPIVLVTRPPTLEGFTTGAAKLAALNGNYELSTGLPPTPPTVTAQLPDGPARFRTLPVEEALTGLQTKPPSAKPNPTDALPIIRVELSTARFGTDRGSLTLPAWAFHAPDTLGPIAWPALPPEAFWQFENRTEGALFQPATLAADGTLTVHLPAPPDPCPGQPLVRHEPVVHESPTAVSVGVRAVIMSTAPGDPRADCARTLVLRTEPHQIRLAAPLGARVLVNDHGSPIPVG